MITKILLNGLLDLDQEARIKEITVGDIMKISDDINEYLSKGVKVVKYKTGKRT